MELTQERLKELLHYDPETGVFTWRRSRPGVNPGDVAGATLPKGYRTICVDGSQNLAHRLAWLYAHGEFPNGKLDHKDRDKANNRMSNLRLATSSLNALNTGTRTSNTSGHTGVYWNKKTQKWAARIRVNHMGHFLGYFDNIEGAVTARKTAEVILGVSEFCPQ